MAVQTVIFQMKYCDVFLSKNKKNITFFASENCHFYNFSYQTTRNVRLNNLAAVRNEFPCSMKDP